MWRPRTGVLCTSAPPPPVRSKPFSPRRSFGRLSPATRPLAAGRRTPRGAPLPPPPPRCSRLYCTYITVWAWTPASRVLPPPMRDVGLLPVSPWGLPARRAVGSVVAVGRVSQAGGGGADAGAHLSVRVGGRAVVTHPCLDTRHGSGAARSPVAGKAGGWHTHARAREGRGGGGRGCCHQAGFRRGGHPIAGGGPRSPLGGPRSPLGGPRTPPAAVFFFCDAGIGARNEPCWPQSSGSGPPAPVLVHTRRSDEGGGELSKIGTK